jgi:hypothetical protein
MLQCCTSAGIIPRHGPSSSIGVVHYTSRGSLHRAAYLRPPPRGGFSWPRSVLVLLDQGFSCKPQPSLWYLLGWVSSFDVLWTKDSRVLGHCLVSRWWDAWVVRLPCQGKSHHCLTSWQGRSTCPAAAAHRTRRGAASATLQPTPWGALGRAR